MVHKVDGWPVASALLLLLLLIGAKVSCAVRSSTQPPNFVIILTDDQDVVLNGMVVGKLWRIGQWLDVDFK